MASSSSWDGEREKVDLTAVSPQHPVVRGRILEQYKTENRRRRGRENEQR